MRRVLKWTAIALGAIMVAFVGSVYALSSAAFNKKYDVPTGHDIVVPSDSASIARGEHLVKSAATCAECHGADAGGTVMEGGPIGTLVAPNLTTGKGSAVAAFTPADWERAIRHGVRRDGTSLIVMPAEVFAHLSDEDVGAIIAYLRQAPPVDREFPESGFTFLGRALVGFGKMPILVAGKTPGVEHVSTVVPDTTVTYGRYLADIGGCRGCHGLELSGGSVAGPPGAPPASNLTPAGIGHWSRDDFARAVREGRRPDGSQLSEFMPWKVLGGMSDDEIAALWAYLQAVPPKEFGGK
ncbi:MAG TPA: c-type cytochrome [Gemmatimonadaceae bacterium]|nr:c-type cytochrome [Gemmatimonadaceae bacterium]